MSAACDAVMCAWVGISADQWERTGEYEREHVRRGYGLSAQRCLDTVAQTVTDNLLAAVAPHAVVQGGVGGVRSVSLAAVEREVARLAWDGL